MRGAISLMSAPAANARSEPVRTMARMEDWSSKTRRAVLSSLMSGVQRALSCLGRLSVTVFLKYGQPREKNMDYG